MSSNDSGLLTKLAGEGGNDRGDDTEPECDGEGHSGEDRHFRRQIAERASPGTSHEAELCQLTGGYQSDLRA